MSYTVEAKRIRNKNKDSLAIGGELNISLLKLLKRKLYPSDDCKLYYPI